MNKINNLITILDSIASSLFGLASLVGVALLFVAEDKQLILGCTLGLALMCLAYSPLVRKNFLVRIGLIVATIIIVAY